jgi:hypothetical protein
MDLEEKLSSLSKGFEGGVIWCERSVCDSDYRWVISNIEHDQNVNLLDDSKDLPHFKVQYRDRNVRYADKDFLSC